MARSRADEGDLLKVREFCEKIRAFRSDTALDDQLGYVLCGPLKGIEGASRGFHNLKEYDPVPLGINEG